jgi:hypothetical protein
VPAAQQTYVSSILNVYEDIATSIFFSVNASTASESSLYIAVTLLPASPYQYFFPRTLVLPLSSQLRNLCTCILCSYSRIIAGTAAGATKTGGAAIGANPATGAGMAVGVLGAIVALL